jgi:hypothetical protein
MERAKLITTTNSSEVDKSQNEKKANHQNPNTESEWLAR